MAKLSLKEPPCNSPVSARLIAAYEDTTIFVLLTVEALGHFFGNTLGLGGVLAVVVGVGVGVVVASIGIASIIGLITLDIFSFFIVLIILNSIIGTGLIGIIGVLSIISVCILSDRIASICIIIDVGVGIVIIDIIIVVLGFSNNVHIATFVSVAGIGVSVGVGIDVVIISIGIVVIVVVIVVSHCSNIIDIGRTTRPRQSHDGAKVGEHEERLDLHGERREVEKVLIWEIYN